MFERGFKAWCERYSVERRSLLGLAPDAPLDMRALAKHLGVRVWTPHDVPGLGAETLQVLLRNNGVAPSCWSAVTLVVKDKVLVILNASHSPARQASDLAHELAHRIRGHEAEEVSVTPDGLMMLKSYDPVQEDEADWLSGCLLLPREACMTIKRQGLTAAEAATTYGVSSRMITYRLSMTGANRQFGGRRAA